MRKGSEYKIPSGCTIVTADPFNADSFKHKIPKGSSFIQLLGVSHPGPSKKNLFREIDYASAKASAEAATHAGCEHFIYISVAQTPTSIMKDYQECRADCEELILKSGIKPTIIRPWYIIGPGHYWPVFFLPLFKILEWIPATSLKAKALRLVYLQQFLKTIITAVENPSSKIRFIEIEEIRSLK